MAFAAPRILKAPTGCRFSSLSHASPAMSEGTRSSGVRIAMPLIRSRAAVTSLSDGAVSVCVITQLRKRASKAIDERDVWNERLHTWPAPQREVNGDLF